MRYSGHCHCQRNTVEVQTDIEFGKLVPRACDCDACQSQALPTAMISDPALQISLKDNHLEKRKNGSGQATFYHCSYCGQLLAVGAEIDGQVRGAVNPYLFHSTNFPDAVKVQPRLLSKEEKQKRWREIWGSLTISSHHYFATKPLDNERKDND